MKRAIQVIFVIFQTTNRANGGVESITQIIEHCQQIEPQIVTQIETPVNQRWQAAGAPVQVWNIPYRIGSGFWQSPWQARGHRLYSLWQTNLQMYALVRQTGCCVVHCNDPSAFWHTALGAKLAGAKLVFNIRDTKAPNESYGWKWQLAMRISDRLVVLSQEMKQFLSDRFPHLQHQPSKIQPIYSIVEPQQLHPVAPEQRQQLRARLGIAPHTFAVGYIAAFNPKKAQLPLIERAGVPLQQAIPNLQLYMIGDFEPDTNPYAQQCLAAANDLGLQSTLTFIGYTSTVADWYRALDLAIVASRQEGLARCMIESLACGTPVISFDVCSAQEILTHYQCGRVVVQGDYLSLTQAVTELASKPSLWRSLHQNATSVAAKLFQPEPIIHQYEKLYRTLATPISPESQISSPPLPQSQRVGP
ncbi:glycosyltransferase family 4 protein [Geitlerinema calcuttense]|uniref:Glycosyltransferase family 4 protein n=1 Tax=Geitlerinema calcuttense NRMC-F 0142 TaxID=2922238 RepID=A0ABT7LYH4_9CYAN|nr:glycosyltransferase family 4 protein [Geitlerinema calcuttense]MDI9636390.1 glycosyltransferase family 4 protein [Geitlerinema splendidum]MDL5057063.1 glycosyltransferase family 4 protein [Geitlerinema calcuttense NRMC-F 0142]